MIIEPDRVFKFLCYRLRDRGVDAATVAHLIEENMALADRLGIEDEGQLVRLVELQFRFLRPQLADPLTLSALTATLVRLDWPMGRRLSFIERQLIGRESREKQ